MGRSQGPFGRYFVAYDTVEDRWEVLSSHEGHTKCPTHRLFQPVASLDVSYKPQQAS